MEINHRSDANAISSNSNRSFKRIETICLFLTSFFAQFEYEIILILDESHLDTQILRRSFLKFWERWRRPSPNTHLPNLELFWWL